MIPYPHLGDLNWMRSFPCLAGLVYFSLNASGEDIFYRQSRCRIRKSCTIIRGTRGDFSHPHRRDIKQAIGQYFAPFRVFFSDLNFFHIRCAPHHTDSLERDLEKSPNHDLLKGYFKFGPMSYTLHGTQDTLPAPNWRIIDLESGQKMKTHHSTVLNHYIMALESMTGFLPETSWTPGPGVRTQFSTMSSRSKLMVFRYKFFGTLFPMPIP